MYVCSSDSPAICSPAVVIDTSLCFVATSGDRKLTERVTIWVVYW